MDTYKGTLFEGEALDLYRELGPMIGENWQLLTDEPVEFEK